MRLQIQAMLKVNQFDLTFNKPMQCLGWSEIFTLYLRPAGGQERPLGYPEAPQLEPYNKQPAKQQERPLGYPEAPQLEPHKKQPQNGDWTRMCLERPF